VRVAGPGKPCVFSLFTLFNKCERELEELDRHMRVKAAKSICIRFRHRFDAPCDELMSIHGDTHKWVSKCRYFGYFSQKNI